MTKLEKLFLKVAKYSLEPIGYDFNKLTVEEQKIYENQKTIDVIKKEIDIQARWNFMKKVAEKLHEPFDWKKLKTD